MKITRSAFISHLIDEQKADIEFRLLHIIMNIIMNTRYLSCLVSITFGLWGIF